MIIGVMGAAGAGKDEFAKIAGTYGFQRTAFGDAVKHELSDLLTSAEVCFEHRHLWGDQQDKEALLRIRRTTAVFRPVWKGFLAGHTIDSSAGWFYFNARSLMQWYATAYRRAQDPYYWVKKTMQHIELSEDIRDWVIPDVRFNTEAEAIRERGGILVRVDREKDIQISNMDHVSEQEWRGITPDYQLPNLGTLSEFHGLSNACMRCIRER